MKYINILLIASIATLLSCSSGPFGKKVKEPFRGSAYESNNRWFRGTGKGESSQDNIALGKADIAAKAQLAGQVNTTMKQVTDQYLTKAFINAALILSVPDFPRVPHPPKTKGNRSRALRTCLYRYKCRVIKKTITINIKKTNSYREFSYTETK